MIVINEWMNRLTEELKTAFGNRLFFVGLQGSYRRGESHKDSDIDAVVILDSLSLADLKTYKSILAGMPDNDKACGFVGGEKELHHWARHELFQFVSDTVSYYGSLEKLLPTISREDIVDGVKVGASALYHACCHAYLHGKPEMLPELYKGTFFVLLSKYYLSSGKYLNSKSELLSLLAGMDREILTKSMMLKSDPVETVKDSDEYYDALMRWSAEIITSEL